MNLLESLGVLYLTLVLMALLDTQFGDKSFGRSCFCPVEETPKVKAAQLEQSERRGKPRVCYDVLMQGFVAARIVSKRCPEDDLTTTATGKFERQSQDKTTDLTASHILADALPALLAGGLVALMLFLSNLFSDFVAREAFRRRPRRAEASAQVEIAKKYAKEVERVEIDKSTEGMANATSGNEPASHSLDTSEGKDSLNQPIAASAGNLVDHSEDSEVFDDSDDFKEPANDEAEIEYIDGLFRPIFQYAFEDDLEGEPGSNLANRWLSDE